ncbi:hypothetical protein SISNIDRAFT_490284 [Sistotremastrum niveocremeum HHB9708]|uniref:Plasmid pRiA4b Orf3-like domain-containing protein n=1 Tax=Sistotremastrum niveocremeum HHB9708 TaxID=1314777 RepID=A0A164P1S3_9AGAM|nr:hypothetical protein SISNIDRAFT_490284 [Sistotremastrum niveocremeum HHB9708]
MNKFVPAKNSLGEAHLWGLRKYDASGFPEFELERGYQRMMVNQILYHSYGVRVPEKQFVDHLMAKKKSKLEKLDVTSLKKRDYVISLSFPWIPLSPMSSDAHDEHFKNGDVEPHLITRKFKVSGGINLDTLQDKILQPIIGWERNAHAWLFTDLRDGACFGPKGCSAQDIMHVGMLCYDFLKADDYTLAHLCQKEGERIEYRYDLGDNWLQNLKVEKILSEEESDGAAVLIEGHGMCPPENGGGNSVWSGDIYRLIHGTQDEKKKIRLKLANARNITAPSGSIDPKHFSLEEAKERLRAALHSHSSLRDGARTNYIFPGAPTQDILHMINPPRRGAAVNRTIVPGCEHTLTGVTQEVISDRRDKNAKALCAVCGKAQDLKYVPFFVVDLEHSLKSIFAVYSDDWQEHRKNCRRPKPRAT